MDRRTVAALKRALDEADQALIEVCDYDFTPEAAAESGFWKRGGQGKRAFQRIDAARRALAKLESR